MKISYLFLGLGTIALFTSSCKNDTTKPKSTTSVLQKLIEQEDTDGDKKITIEDHGPKKFVYTDADQNSHTIEGTYYLSNLLQELAIVENSKMISIEKVKERPSSRISRLIKTRFWNNLTRSIDNKGLEKVLEDTKSNVDTLRLYIPHEDGEALQYFQTIAQENSKVKVVQLAKDLTPEYVKTLNDKPGILNIAYTINEGVYTGKPFVVPGGRFNEMYGWDSYFESIGLLIDGRADLAMAMADNFAYQIKYYGKILNANRSYYLTRTQPPFFTSLLKEIYLNNPNVSKDWLKKNLSMAIKEYETVWMKKGVRLTNTGLNRFYGEGIGIPPETEEGHFDFVLKKFAQKHKLSPEEFASKYKSGELIDEDLDLYFTHDRSMRESGHDTSNRLDDICANLNTVGINSLLYKYEVDIAFLIKEVYGDEFEYLGKKYTSKDWVLKSEKRKDLMNKFMWNEEEGAYYDYDFVSKTQQKIESATNYYPLWVGLCSENQQVKVVKHLTSGKLLQKGGVAGTVDIADKTDPNAPQRQWDYPNGWAPHQMIIWRGLMASGNNDKAKELAYRWLWMITKNAVNYNGTIPEKYDVVKCTHKVYAEYGNVGTEFDYNTPSGFGWMNASYQLGLTFLDKELRAQLDNLVDPDEIFNK